MDVTLIVNPFASAVSEPRVRAVEEELRRAGSVRTLMTERPWHGAELAAGVGRDEALVVFSGDGGFNEVLNGVPEGVSVGFLPGGGRAFSPVRSGCRMSRSPRRARWRTRSSMGAGAGFPWAG